MNNLFLNIERRKSVLNADLASLSSCIVVVPKLKDKKTPLDLYLKFEYLVVVQEHLRVENNVKGPLDLIKLLEDRTYVETNVHVVKSL